VPLRLLGCDEVVRDLDAEGGAEAALLDCSAII
jgi:hypothetical protein